MIIPSSSSSSSSFPPRGTFPSFLRRRRSPLCCSLLLLFHGKPKASLSVRWRCSQSQATHGGGEYTSKKVFSLPLSPHDTHRRRKKGGVAALQEKEKRGGIRQWENRLLFIGFFLGGHCKNAIGIGEISRLANPAPVVAR